MTYATLLRVPVRMVVSGSIVERREPDEVLSIIERFGPDFAFRRIEV